MQPDNENNRNSETDKPVEETIKEKFNKYCDENPDALECRIYED